MTDIANPNPASRESRDKPLDFIRQRIVDDNASGKYGGRVHTRFPPEPNGYLHIGHAKSICLNFGIAAEFGGLCNLRFDDTNPEAEEVEYVDSIKNDVRWLGFDWGDREFYASDYFDRLYELAVDLIRQGKAYVCSLTAEQVGEYRGPWNAPGRPCPDRDRPISENLDLFQRMKAGEFPDGKYTLRAKIDMSSSNMNLRDPAMYRIRHAAHHRTGNRWCIYPTYDWTHGQNDSFENITHSICTLEFENHRPLYDWFIDQLGIHHPSQIEFARLNLSYTVMSKRRLLELVKGRLVDGWDDPRMPTLCGLRRRGYTPEAIRNFCTRIGVTKYNALTDLALLEESLREHLNRVAPRFLGVLRPLKVVIENYPSHKSEWREAINNPEDESAGTRRVPFGRELYIEQDDFMTNPPKDFFRLAPGREVRLRYAYFLKCEEVVTDPETGGVIELRCSYDPETAGGKAPDGRKVKGTIHWVEASQAVDAEVRLYDVLFSREDPSDVPAGEDWKTYLNFNSRQVLEGCKLEPHVAAMPPGQAFQLERLGYFCIDTKDSRPEAIVLNRSVPLKDTWGKIQKRQGST
jgi:glutaminyl-tRNA synthetase